MNWRRIIGLCAASVVLAGCSNWQYNVTTKGVAFEKVQVAPNGFVIGLTKADTIVGGRPCKRGWLHLHPNGVPAAFTAAAEIDLGKVKILADTWVFENQAGVITVCAFPRDTMVQGYVCRGSGGPTGVQTAFYPDGALKEFFPRGDTRVDGVLCRSGSWIGSAVELHENGRLKSAELGEDLTRDGVTIRKGTRAKFGPNGRIHPPQGSN